MTTTTTLPDICHQADIKTLVDNFYDKVNRDEHIGPVFRCQSQIYWPMHLLTVYDFWNAELLTASPAAARSFPAHMALPTERTHVQRWIQLFHATVDEHFTGPKAELAKQKSARVVAL